MKKLIFLFLIVFVSSCIDTSEENKQLKEINYQLRSENYELTQKKESTLRSYQSTKEIISRNENLINEQNQELQNPKCKYYIVLQIKQRTATLDLEEHLKNSINSVNLTIETSRNFYKSVNPGDVLENSFKGGSFLIDGDISELRIAVKNKYIK